MVAIGAGSQEAAAKQMEQLGAQKHCRPLEEAVGDGPIHRGAPAAFWSMGFKRADITRLAELPHLKLVVPLKDTGQKVYYKSAACNATAIGTEPGLFEVVNLKTERGAAVQRGGSDRRTGGLCDRLDGGAGDFSV